MLTQRSRYALRAMLYRMKPLHTCIASGILLASCDGPTPAPTPTPTATSTPVNQAPQFTSSATATATEPGITVFYTATATDPEASPVTFTIAGGADAAQFNLTAAGALTFKDQFPALGINFDEPEDADSDNVYEVTLQASDGVATSSLPLRVTVVPNYREITTNRSVSGLQPFACAAYNDLEDRLIVYAVQKDGRVYRYRGSTPAALALDLSDIVASEGMLSCATWVFSQDTPTGSRQMRTLFLSLVTKSGDFEVHAFQDGFTLGRPYEPDQVRASDRLLLRVPGAASMRNPGGGLLAGVASGAGLLVGIGDFGNSDAMQDSTGYAGKLLLFTRAGTSTSHEVLASGLRDPATLAAGLLASDGPSGYYIGDRGEEREEVNWVARNSSGTNFGWPYFDGTRQIRSGAPSGLTPPLLEYEHGTGPLKGNSIVMGPLNSTRLGRNRSVHLFFGDRANGNLWSVARSRLALGRTLPSSQFAYHSNHMAIDAGRIDRPVMIGEALADVHIFIVDEDGEIFEVR